MMTRVFRKKGNWGFEIADCRFGNAQSILRQAQDK